ncbi:calcium-translocating P-type ATPase, PMCA-type [Clostridium baratii]|uniref:calcium-translocating P-type ATPase, PMCA-type n=2 Tax=Clostridium baratii TaxID=1561 RepID=UPI001C015267|nr:calcium-translocating P-type ATPase, PMCA-type [Clostridium baratii]MBT9832173.1 calcium-translocating P-type ATPase, PMCA-type [Clostridium baratii]
MKESYHSFNKEEVLEKLNVTEEGLTDEEASLRLKTYGYNELRKVPKKSIWKMLKEQLSDIMVLILIVAAILSIILNEWTEAIVIIAIVLLDAIIGILQEKKATDAMEALKNMSAPTARVLRQGQESVVKAAELVPGDIVYLEDGFIVPADLRLIETNNLKIQEASLTGESVPSEKDSEDILRENAPLGDRTNMAYTSSIVMYGNGIGVVTATGMDTEVGNIAHMLDNQDEFDTPLKRKLDSVGKVLSVVGIVVCILIFSIGYFYGRPIIPLLMTAISLAISIIPEGLPATATIVMALGVQRMAKQNALVRKLPAVETLGGATVICCDKTGTLTQNKMTVTHIAMNGDFEKGKATPVHEESKKYANLYKDLIFASALCNNATLDPDNIGEILGDPTEGALIFLAKEFGITQAEFEKQYPREFEQPFDSDRKRMTTVHIIDDEIIAYTKGAVDEMLPLCTKIATNKGIRDITEKDKENILNLCLKMSSDALRILGFAKRTLKSIPEDDDANIEFDLTFIGAVGMIDPPREEVIDAVETCRTAGIRTIMITGDHKVTAMAIAKQLHIYREGNIVISGDELDNMTDDELDKAVVKATVFARVSPSDKLRIIKSLNKIGEVTAMTGDGVNDSPALKSANIGVAMGKSGTDVAKDSADIILMDDNFTTIEYAIMEGRRVYRNIQKVIQFLLAGNIAEILTLFIATLLNWDAPILAVHVLLINLATDTLPALALGIDPASKNIMKHKPIKSNSLFEKGLVFRVILHGIYITIATIFAYQVGIRTDSYEVGMTMAFLVLAISQLFHALNQRSNTDSVFTKGNGHNSYLFFAMIISALIIAVILVIPALREFFSLTTLNANEWMIVLALALLPLFLVEVTKLIKRKFKVY